MPNYDYFEEETYTKGLNREDTIELQVRVVAFNYSKGVWDCFEYSLKILIALLPKEIRQQFKPLPHDLSEAGIDACYNQFVAIQEKIEVDTNMIFKRRFIKTFE